MINKLYTPHPALLQYINCILVMHLQLEEDQQPVICPYPPIPQHCLIFYLDDKVLSRKEGDEHFKTYSRSIIIGPQVTRVNLMVRRSHKAILVGFEPGGLFRLLGIPMFQLFDGGFNASEIIGSEIDIVVQQLRHSKTYDEMPSIVEKYFLDKLHHLKDQLPFDLAIKELIKNDGNIPIEKIASLSCLSLRQFERKCQERIGLPPRFFARLARFSKAYRLRERQPHLTWTNIAHECNYYDQMHFIRDFKEFAGVTPTLMEDVLVKTPFRMQIEFDL